MRIWKQRKEQLPALLFIVSMSPPGYPSAGLLPRRARFRFAQQDHCSSTASVSLNFRMARHPAGMDWNTDERLRGIRFYKERWPVIARRVMLSATKELHWAFGCWRDRGSWQPLLPS
jgi:hypothetical protein